MDSQIQKKNIVILGAGFGGLKCALALEKQMRRFPVPLFEHFNIILIDKNSYHTYMPALYEIATTHKEDADALSLKKAATVPIEEIMEDKKIDFYQAPVQSIDLPNKKINFGEDTSLSFEYLVLALGSVSMFFNIEGAENYALPLKSFRDAVKIRNRLEKIFSSEYPSSRPMESRQSGAQSAFHGASPRIVIAGAGTTGVEFAGELAGFIKKTQEKHQRFFEAEITLIDGAPTALNGFDQKVIEKVEKRLKKLEINLNPEKLIREVRQNSLTCQNKNGDRETIEYDLLIWTTGVQSHDIVRNLPLSLDKKGGAMVNECLCCISSESDIEVEKKIFAIGDNAYFLESSANFPLPSTARIAITQGKTAAQNIILDIFKKPKKEYAIKSYPFVIPVGGKYAVSEIGRFRISGFFGWVLKMFIELYYLTSILPFKKAFGYWTRGLKIFVKND